MRHNGLVHVISFCLVFIMWVCMMTTPPIKKKHYTGIILCIFQYFFLIQVC